MKQSLLKTNHNYLNIAYIAILLLHITLSNYIFDTYTIDRILVMLYMLFSILYLLLFNPKIAFRTNLLKSFLVILFIYTLIQSFTSPYINSSFEIKQQQFISITFLIYIIYYQIHKTDTYSTGDFLHLILVLSYMIFTVIIIDYALSISSTDEYTLTQSIHKYFKNVRVLNHLQTIMIPSLMLYFLDKKNILYESAAIFAILLHFLFVLYTGGRGTLYSVEAVILFVFISNYKNEQSRHIFYMVQSLLIFAVLIYYFIPHGGSSTHITEVSSSGRMLIYKTVIPYIVDLKYSFTAVGFSSVDIAVTHFLHPHNIFLYIFLGSGTVGLVSFIIFMIYIIIKILKHYFKNNNLTTKYLLMIFFAPLIHSFVSGIYITPLTALLFIYFLIVFLKDYMPNTDKVIHKKYIAYINMALITIISVCGLISIKDNLLIKSRYQYESKEKKRLYHPGVMLYSDKIFKEKKDT